MKNKERLFDILITTLIVLIALSLTLKCFQNDTFYTIANGKSIFKHGVDMLDHFSIHNLPYTYPHWLYDVLIAILYNIGGFKLLYISSIIIYIIINLLIYFLTKNLYKNRIISGFITIITCLSIQLFITTRAQSITYILFILELFIIEKYLSTSNKKYLILLPIISLLIVNMHCATWPLFFILFLPSTFEYIISKFKNNLIIDRFDVIEYRHIKYLFLVILLSLFTGLIVPNGNTSYTYLIKIAFGNTFTFISEHQPTTLIKYPSLIFYLVLYISILVFIKKKIKLRDFLLSFGLFILAFYSRRHIVLLIILSSFPLTSILSDYISDEITNSFLRIFTNKFIYIILILSTLSFSIYSINLKEHNQDYIDNRIYPVEASNYIIKNLDINDIRLYNEYDYGSYLVFRNIPVFIDSRSDLYTSEFNGLKRSITGDMIDTLYNYQEIFNYYDITHIIVHKNNFKYKNSILYELLSLDKDYSIIYEDQYFALFEKKV